MTSMDYDKLNDQEYVSGETIIVNSVESLQPNKNDSIMGDSIIRDGSEIYKSVVPITDNEHRNLLEGYEIKECEIRSKRITIQGDKICPRTASLGTMGFRN